MSSGKLNSPTRFVCVHNRNRDNYEVALGLEEAGLLDCLVTDFYRPDWLPLPGAVGRRHRAGLSSARVRSSLLSCLIQYGGQALRLAAERVFRRSDAVLARQAARRAASQGSAVYAYSSYLPDRAALPAGVPVIDFEYHPHPQLSLELLERDAAAWPEVSWSLARERDIAANEPLTVGWQATDAVVCASSMTRRTLIAAGCPEERITVVPYGCAVAQAPPRPRPPGPCRFLFVGQGIQRKGLHHLARAWRDAGLDDAELVVVSYLIDPGIAPQLDQPGITVLGRQDREALDALFSSADVFVMPSLVEGFGLVYLEALAAGCHVIGTSNTGLPDLPLSSKAATIVPPGDSAELTAALIRLAAAKRSGQLDPAAIQAETDRWTWAHFRQGIADHARAVLLRANPGQG